MKSRDIKQIKILGELLHDQKDRVRDLVDNNKLQLSKEAVNFSKEIIEKTDSHAFVNAKTINEIYKDKFQGDAKAKEYREIANVINHYLEDY